MTRARYRYRYRRESANGKTNETTSLKSFEKLLQDAQPGDRFIVGKVAWVLVTGEGADVKIPFERAEDADAKENR